jgi:hypothetical protein
MTIRPLSMRRALCAAVLVASVSACEFIDPITENPNTVPVATLDQLLVSTTVNTFDYSLGQPGFVWMQQTDVTATFNGWSTYELLNLDAEYEYWIAYTGLGGDNTGKSGGGGLNDVRTGIEQAEELDRRTYAGIFKVYEAYLVGTVASLWGDVAYTEAVTDGIQQPKLDPQRDVYDSLFVVLDEAIADLQSGEGANPGANDLVFGGDAAKWIAVARTLKARHHLHWVERDGDARYTAALNEAQQGIRDAGGDWVAPHEDTLDEENAWWNWGGGTTWVAGEYLMELLKARSDPRLPYYFSEADGDWAGTYVGSAPGVSAGDPERDASLIVCADHSRAGCLGVGFGARDFDFPNLTCAENYFIIAEAQAALVNDGAARTALDDALTCVEERWVLWGAVVDLSAEKAANDGLTGPALFDEIMEQKYIAQFLNGDIYNDYKRTCRPQVTTYNNQVIPGRVYYPEAAELANPNIPPRSEQPARNDNDPNPCPTGP